MSAGRGKTRDAVVQLAGGCDLRCAVCAASASGAPEVGAQGGRRLTIRGAPRLADAIDLARRARALGWDEIAVHAHGDASWDPGALRAAGVDAVQVPLFSEREAEHDRVAARAGSLDASLAFLARAAEAGLGAEIEVPLFAPERSRPAEIVRRALASVGRLAAARFVVARGRVPAELVAPPTDVLGGVLAEALDACAVGGVRAAIGRDQGVPFCALAAREDLLGSAFRFDPRRAVPPARGASRPEPPCDACACREQCAGVSDAQLGAHGARGIMPFARRPAALYEQRTSSRREWTDAERGAARRAGLLVLRPTVNCNQDCRFCSANETSANVWTSRDAMLRQIARAASRGVRRVAFGGGEPTLARELAEYVRAARELGVPEVELVTNGVLLDREAKVRALAEAGLTHAFVSLHAHDELLSRHLTQKIGDFARTVRAIELLDAAGVKTAVNHVITRQNARFLGDFVAFVRERFGGTVAISFALMTPQYKALEVIDAMPRMSEVRPHLEAALARAIELEQPCWVGSRQGIPPCQLGAFRAWSDVLEHAAAALAEDAPQKVRAEACARCRYVEVCTGVWRPYAEVFGTGELAPIEGAPFTAEDRAAIARAKSEPWGLPAGGFESVPEILRDRAAERALEGARPSANDGELAAGALGTIAFSPVRTRALRVALFGAGARARAIARALRGVAGMTLDALVSPHAPGIDRADFGDCPAWSDAGEAIDDVRPDVAIVAASREAQASLVRLALSRGLPVLCARPVAPRADELEALLALATPAAPLVVAHDPLHAPELAAMLEAARLGARGRRAHVELRPGIASSPRAFSRAALAPILEDALALAHRAAGAPLAISAVRFRGDARPESIHLALGASDRELDVAIDLLAREPSIRVRAGDHEAIATALDDAVGAAVASFRDLVLARSAPDLETPLAIARSAEAALDALASAGAPFERASAPKHASSFRRR